MITRTLPTRLGAEDKLIDVYLFSLTVFQVLNVLGGVAIAAELLDEPLLGVIPLIVRQVLAALALAVGAFAAVWRYDGKSLWSWLWVALRFRGIPRRAISRPTPLVLDEARDNRWYEVRPPLAWDDRYSQPVARKVRG